MLIRGIANNVYLLITMLKSWLLHFVFKTDTVLYLAPRLLLGFFIFLSIRSEADLRISPGIKEQKQMKKDKIWSCANTLRKANVVVDGAEGRVKHWIERGRVRLSLMLGSLICVLISRNATVEMWRLHKDVRACVNVSLTCLSSKSPGLLGMTDWRSPAPLHAAHPPTHQAWFTPLPHPPICSGNMPDL